MEFINIGFGSMVSRERVVAIVGPDSAPIRRMTQESRERGMLIDATYGAENRVHFHHGQRPCDFVSPAAGKIRRGGRGGSMKKGKTFIVSGPSGVGKSTVLQALLSKRDDLYFSVSATTRPAREGETDGVHYHFLDVETFQQWIAEDQFLEYAEYVGNFYGTPKRFVDEAMEQGKDVILDIEIQGAIQIAAKRPETIRIFIAPPSWAELERRLSSRGTDSQEKIQKRLVRAKVEFQTAHTYDYFVINDSVENAVRELEAIMTAEHCRPQERMEIISGK